MEILIIIAFIIVAVVLLLIELFVVPGISWAGISALACIVYANIYAFIHLGALGGFITMAVSAITCIGSLVLFMRSKTLERLALKKDITSKVNKQAEESVKIGDRGLTTTRLALIGYADIEGKIVEVKSMDGFLSEKTPIVVSRIDEGTILVEKQK